VSNLNVRVPNAAVAVLGGSSAIECRDDNDCRTLTKAVLIECSTRQIFAAIDPVNQDKRVLTGTIAIEPFSQILNVAGDEVELERVEAPGRRRCTESLGVRQTLSGPEKP